MNAITGTTFFISTFFLVIGGLQATDQSLVDYYVKLVTERPQQAAQYEFPKDARMYEAKDTKLRGEFSVDNFPNIYRAFLNDMRILKGVNLY